MMSSQLGVGYEMVAVPFDEGNVPIRKAGGLALRAHAGNTVFRTPNTAVREAEPGAGWPGDLSNTMFDQNGNLVPVEPYAFDMMHGAGETIVMKPSGTFSSGLRGLVPALAMFAGGAVGYKAAHQRKLGGAIAGALAGGILGLLFR